MKDANGKNVVISELKFSRLIETYDEKFDRLQEIGGIINEISDYDLDDSEVPELEKEAEMLENDIDDIADTLGVDLYSGFFDTGVTNRWELYAQIKGAKIVSLREALRG